METEKTGRTLILGAVLLSFFFLPVSCADPASPVPYIISKPAMRCGEISGCCRFAGIEFDFYNSTEKRIDGIEVSCLVYSADGETSPLTGTNRVSARFSDAVGPDETVHLSVSLDAYLRETPEKPFIVDFFSVQRVDFADGTEWTDPLCLYYSRSY